MPQDSIVAEAKNMKIPSIVGAIDWNTLTNNPVEWFSYPFTNLMTASIFWPSVFAVVIAIAWVVSKNLGVVTAAVLITFGIFGSSGYFLAAPEFSLFFAVIAIAGFAGTILQVFITKK